MKYADFRPQIQTGDVMAWSHRKIRSWYDLKIMLVRLFQMSEYCHVGIAIVMGGRVWVLEAVTPHVRLVPLSNLLPCYHITAPELSADQIERGLAMVGKDDVVYSQWEAVKALFGKNDMDDARIQCAELVSGMIGLRCRATPSAVVRTMLANGSTLTEMTL